jgi:hypothetical protein
MDYFHMSGDIPDESENEKTLLKGCMRARAQDFRKCG